MDFIISKIAMSVCALLVVSFLAGALAQDRFVDRESELADVLKDFCSAVDWVLEADSVTSMLWEIPWLSTGNEVNVTISSTAVILRSDGSRALGQPLLPVHTWAFNGTELNKSVLDELDSNAPMISAKSGEPLRIEGAYWIFENEPRLLVFVFKER